MRGKSLAVIMSAALLLSVSACGTKTENTATPQAPDAEPAIEEPATEEPEAEEPEASVSNPWTESD